MNKHLARTFHWGRLRGCGGGGAVGRPEESGRGTQECVRQGEHGRSQHALRYLAWLLLSAQVGLAAGKTVLLVGDSIFDLHEGDKRIEAILKARLDHAAAGVEWSIVNEARAAECIGPVEGKAWCASRTLFTSETEGRYFEVVRQHATADYILVNYSANDSEAYSPEIFRKKLETLGAKLQKDYPGAVVILVTSMYEDPQHSAPYQPDDPKVAAYHNGGLRSDYLEPYNREIRALAAKHGYRVADLNRRMQAETAKGNWDLRARDGWGNPQDDAKHAGDMQWFENIHPNDRGTQVLADALTEAVLGASPAPLPAAPRTASVGASARGAATLTPLGNEGVRLKRGDLEMTFDRNMRGQVLFQGKGTLPTATHWIVLGGAPVRDFHPDGQAAKLEQVRTVFGGAWRMLLRGTAVGPAGRAVTEELRVDLPDDDPGAIITQATFTLTSGAAISLDQAASSSSLLDASRFETAAKPSAFWSFQGGSADWGPDNVMQLGPGFARENDLGMITRRSGEAIAAYGGGVPVVDVWTKEMGLAIAHLAPRPVAASIPTHVETDGRVRMEVVEKPGIRLAAGGKFTTVETLIMVHHGDFYDALHRYAALMRKQGLVVERPNREAYQASWCGWGYEFNFRQSEMLGVRPQLRKLGIHWVTIDDRWFVNYGDWQPRPETFSGGADGFRRMVDEFHQSGFKVQLWWDPLAVEATPGRTSSHVFSGARIAAEHPDWLIQTKDGKPAVWSRNLNVLCPAVPGVQDYIRQLTTRFVRDWGVDGHKLDVVYTAPPCYNPAHHHASPQESVAQFPAVLRAIYETSLALKSDAVIQICPCGTPPNMYWLPYMNQAVTADPIGAGQVRYRTKMYKALMGPRAAVFADHVELTDMVKRGDEYLEQGRDFASAIGTGAVVGTKFVWPAPGAAGFSAEELAPRLRNLLTPEKEDHWQKWLAIYNRLMLSDGEYLNLYDIAYDAPETHVIRRDGKMYYAFFAAKGTEWNGPLELRGLGAGDYEVRDYANSRDLGRISGGKPVLRASFRGSLLIEVRPLETARRSEPDARIYSANEP
jgi:alpha-galactosidase